MRVLGIDPGSVRTGWGVVERVGNRVCGRGAGVIRSRANAPLEERLRCIYAALVELITAHAPEVVAVEDVFVAKYANAALKLGHVRGVALLAAANAGLLVHAVPPAAVKRCLTGSGRADKSQVARLVGAILGMRDLPEVDATDALAVAIAHVQSAPLRNATVLRANA